ncbi:MAG TPA: hypothetical protein VMT50_07145 [Steroidobacteraceae bacterium]|nr:hypothetical protein [Steroidobacteraceae bacterium]
MRTSFRVVDTGVREGRFNIALDQAMLDEHRAGRLRDTLRFMRFPPTVLIGRHQVLRHEVDLEHCRRLGIGVGRRITGGGAIYLDEGQLGWGLICHRAALGGGTLEHLAAEVCTAVAKGLSRLGVDARYRPRNDIEVDGRKLSGSGGYFDGDTVVYQGTVLVDLDPSAMVAALRVPPAKLERRHLDTVAQRVVTLRELLGRRAPSLPEVQGELRRALSEHFGVDWCEEKLSAREDAAAWARYREEIGTEDFVAGTGDPVASEEARIGTHAAPGGTVTMYVRLQEAARRRIAQVLITGDFFVAPPRAILDLEAALRGAPIEEAGEVIERFFNDHPVSAHSLSAADFAAALAAALRGTAPG